MFRPVSGKKASSIERVLLVDDEEEVVELDWLKLENVLDELVEDTALELVEEVEEVEVEDVRDVER